MSRNVVAWFPHIALVWAAIAVSCGESSAAVTTAPVSERPVYCMIGKDRIAVMHDIWGIEDDLRELDEAARAADAGQ